MRAKQMETMGRQRANSAQVYRVYVLNTLQETQRTLCDDRGVQMIRTTIQSDCLSPYCVCPPAHLKLLLFDGLCTVYASFYLSICLPSLILTSVYGHPVISLFLSLCPPLSLIPPLHQPIQLFAGMSCSPPPHAHMDFWGLILIILKTEKNRVYLLRS